MTLVELQSIIPATQAALRGVMDQLVAAGLITGRWRIPDHRPLDHSVTRTHSLLAAMIDHGAFPVGTTLPARHLLGTILQAGPADVRGALNRLANDQVIHLAGNARPRVLAAQLYGPARAAWPPGPGTVHDALPSTGRPGAGFDRSTLGQIGCAARARFRLGICAGPDALADQELRMAHVVRLLVTKTYEETSQPGTGASAQVRSAAARVMACHALPLDAALHERMFRLAVLATALHDLADARGRHTCTPPSPRWLPQQHLAHRHPVPEGS
ncbi:hypothetical protein ACWF9B_01375 [Streptomyces sp. NPDC055089]